LLPPQELRKDTFPNDMDEGCMSAEEEREQRRGWRENGEPLDENNDFTLGFGSQTILNSGMARAGAIVERINDFTYEAGAMKLPAKRIPNQ
jgi:hypothetical protein